MADSPKQSKLPPDENPWRTAGLVTGLGVELAVCVALGWWIGSVFDERYGTRNGYVIGVVIGLIAGIGSAVGLIRRYTGARRP